MSQTFKDIGTIGQLRAAVAAFADRRDDEIVHVQVVGSEGVWNMSLTIAPVFQFDGGMVVQMTHRDLARLVEKDPPSNG